MFQFHGKTRKIQFQTLNISFSRKKLQFCFSTIFHFLSLLYVSVPCPDSCSLPTSELSFTTFEPTMQFSVLFGNLFASSLLLLWCITILSLKFKTSAKLFFSLKNKFWPNNLLRMKILTYFSRIKKILHLAGVFLIGIAT